MKVYEHLVVPKTLILVRQKAQMEAMDTKAS
jgi:hypothetical protein